MVNPDLTVSMDQCVIVQSVAMIMETVDELEWDISECGPRSVAK